MKRSKITTAAPKSDESPSKYDGLALAIAKTFPKVSEIPSAATGELFLKVSPTLADMFVGKQPVANPTPSSAENKNN